MQQQGGSQYGVAPPELSPPFFSGGGTGARQQRVVGIHGGVVEHLQQQPVAEAASPISSRSAPPISIFDDFGGGGVVTRGIADDEALGAGDEGERGGSGGGNRWPRQETLVLLKVRSEMDAAFRDATLKGPLWEDVSRKLSELGYARSAKKCKEKFENVHKYYKRTKEGRAGRQDGKSYRFFSQLEALHTTTSGGATAGGGSSTTTGVSSFSSAFNANFVPTTTTTEPALLGMAAPPGPRVDPPPPPLPPASEHAALPGGAEVGPMVGVGGISFSSNTSSSSSSESDGGEDTDEGALPDGNRKRKRDGWLASGGKTMAFFERLMKTLMERQEAMQQRFLDTIEKREQDRMIREEAWKRQEMARLNREYELMAQERAMAANRDAAVISFLQKFTGTVKNTPPPPPTNIAVVSVLPSPELSREETPPPPPLSAEKVRQGNEIVLHQPLQQSTEPNAPAAATVAELPDTGDMVSPSSLSSSRWPKAEVLALIRLRSGLETRYMDAGPKGPLWEEISMGMKRLGYNRSTKRCKEKWENINKYFKKVKEGNKKRPEDAKTCPYYHELDALYRRKQQQEITAIIPAPSLSEQESNIAAAGNKIPAVVRTNAGNGVNHEVGGGGGSSQMPRSNGIGLSQVFFGGSGGGSGGGGIALKKPEDILKELMEQQHRGDEDEYDDDDEEEDDDDEDGKLQYEVQFQRQNVGSAGSARSGNGNPSENAPAPSASNAGSFLAMVQ